MIFNKIAIHEGLHWTETSIKFLYVQKLSWVFQLLLALKRAEIKQRISHFWSGEICRTFFPSFWICAAARIDCYWEDGAPFLMQYFQLPTRVWPEFLIKSSEGLFFSYIIILPLVFILIKFFKIHMGRLHFVFFCFVSANVPLV